MYFDIKFSNMELDNKLKINCIKFKCLTFINYNNLRQNETDILKVFLTLILNL